MTEPTELIPAGEWCADDAVLLREHWPAPLVEAVCKKSAERYRAVQRNALEAAAEHVRDYVWLYGVNPDAEQCAYEIRKLADEERP